MTIFVCALHNMKSFITRDTDQETLFLSRFREKLDEKQRRKNVVRIFILFLFTSNEFGRGNNRMERLINWN